MALSCLAVRRALASCRGLLLNFPMSSAAAAAANSSGPISSSITLKLQAKFQPNHLEVLNESHMHNVPSGSETHFKVIIVSEAFAGKNLLSRHRSVNEALKQELEEKGVHALSIVPKTTEEWSRGKPVQPSPACKGGFGK